MSPSRVVVVIAVFVAVAAAGTGGLAWAFWSASGTGTGAAAVATLDAPTDLTASYSAGSSTVSLSWTASDTVGSAVAPDGYYLSRVSDTTTAPACGTSPSALTSSTSCVDTGVTDGTYSYVVTAVKATWTAASASSNSVAVTNTRPAVTVDQASAQDDPTNTGPVRFTAVFSEPVTDFSASSVVVGGTAPGPGTVTINGSGPAYTISVSGMTGTGTVTASIAAGTVHDANGASNTASTSTDNSVLYDVTAPDAPTPVATAAVTSGASPLYVTNEAVTLSDAATDADSGVGSVSYYYCAGATGSCTSGTGTLIGTSSATGYAATWSTPLPADGSYRVVAVVTDNAGNTSTSDLLQIAVDTTSPSVSAPIVNGHS